MSALLQPCARGRITPQKRRGRELSVCRGLGRQHGRPGQAVSHVNCRRAAPQQGCCWQGDVSEDGSSADRAVLGAEDVCTVAFVA